jgi:hypothetical protein
MRKISIERKTICKRFRIDLLRDLDLLAQQWKPQTSSTRLMELAVEEFIQRQHAAQDKERAHE